MDDKKPPSLDPDEYEAEVKRFIEAGGLKLEDFQVQTKRKVSTADGTYEFDVYARFMALGASYTVLIECKRYSASIKRDQVMTLWAKLMKHSAQKAMLFSTSRFQKGAINYASSCGIALVEFLDGRAVFRTKGDEKSGVSPQVQRIAGLLRRSPGNCVLVGHLGSDEAILQWLRDGPSTTPPPEQDDPTIDTSLPDPYSLRSSRVTPTR